MIIAKALLILITVLFFSFGTVGTFIQTESFKSYCNIMANLEGKTAERNDKNTIDGFNLYEIEKYFGIWRKEYKIYEKDQVILLGDALHFTFVINHLCFFLSIFSAAMYCVLFG